MWNIPSDILYRVGNEMGGPDGVHMVACGASKVHSCLTYLSIKTTCLQWSRVCPYGTIFHWLCSCIHVFRRQPFHFSAGYQLWQFKISLCRTSVPISIKVDYLEKLPMTLNNSGFHHSFWSNTCWSMFSDKLWSVAAVAKFPMEHFCLHTLSFYNRKQKQ